VSLDAARPRCPVLQLPIGVIFGPIKRLDCTQRPRSARFRRQLSLKSDFGSRINVMTSTSANDETVVAESITVCRAEELPEGAMRLIEAEGRKIGVFRCGGGELYAIEDRCSHDDGPLAEGEFDATACTVECPRHGSLFDLRTGRPKTLPAFQPVETFDARVEDGEVKLEI
jgi:3-phenylpropionate/trans-cinnamate dioxygenase ferredoxin component